MKEQDELGIDNFRGRYSKEELSAVNYAAEVGPGDQSVPTMTVTFRRLSRFLARAGLPFFVSLLLAVATLAVPTVAPAGIAVGISVGFAPPAIPIYVQPLCPGPGFIWTPGYWAWDPDIDDYYWVPGVWVLAPFFGGLWTPGYWGWSDRVFIWNEGYWGPVVGFYGGINYGFGYTGFGYEGGYWRGNNFYYNRTVNNINVTNITNVYSQPVRNVGPSGVSFNGGPGGISARPTSAQLAAANQRRATLTSAQQQQMQVARTDPKQRAAINKGRPAIAATTKPGVFTGSGVIGASRAGVPYKSPTGGKAAIGERTRTPKSGAEIRKRSTTPERRLNETQTAPRRMETTKPSPSGEIRKRSTMPERRLNEPQTAPRRMETTKPSPSGEIRKRSAMPERRLNEPQIAPRRMETTKPSPLKEPTRDERGEQR